ncbi:hypothetical protein HaLaN_10035, partial [Haematococcus lacustris]
MRLEVQDSSVFEPGQDAQAGVEPKKKGRFLTTSAINLTDSGLPPGVLSAAHR